MVNKGIVQLNGFYTDEGEKGMACAASSSKLRGMGENTQETTNESSNFRWWPDCLDDKRNTYYCGTADEVIP